MASGWPTSVEPAVATSGFRSSALAENGQCALLHTSKMNASWGRFSLIGPPARPRIWAGPFVAPPPGSTTDAVAVGPPDCEVADSPVRNRTRAASGMVNPELRSGKNWSAVAEAAPVNTRGREDAPASPPLPPVVVVWALAAHGDAAMISATTALARHVLANARRTPLVLTRPPAATSCASSCI